MEQTVVGKSAPAAGPKVSLKGLGIALVVVVVGMKALAAILGAGGGVSAGELRPHESIDGCYRVSIPPVKLQESSKKSPEGIDVHFALWQAGDEAFGVTYFDLPDYVSLSENPHEAMGKAVTDMAKSFAATTPVGGAQELMVEDQPAVEQTFKGSRGTYTLRAIVRDDRRVYTLVYGGKHQPELAKAFLGSFSLTDDLP